MRASACICRKRSSGFTLSGAIGSGARSFLSLTGALGASTSGSGGFSGTGLTARGFFFLGSGGVSTTASIGVSFGLFFEPVGRPCPDASRRKAR